MWYEVDYEKGELTVKEENELTKAEIDAIKKTDDVKYLNQK